MHACKKKNYNSYEYTKKWVLILRNIQSANHDLSKKLIPEQPRICTGKSKIAQVKKNSYHSYEHEYTGGGYIIERSGATYLDGKIEN